MVKNHCSLFKFIFFFFYNDTATTEIYTLSLHDALPISLHFGSSSKGVTGPGGATGSRGPTGARGSTGSSGAQGRSEEHTSELQSQSNLLCRPLLEKKQTAILVNGAFECIEYRSILGRVP